MRTPGLFWLGLTLIGVVGLAGCKNISGGKASPGTVGSTCEAGEDCAQVAVPVCLKMPDGYCSEVCEGGAFDCDDQSVCEQLGDQAFFCLDGCLTANTNDDCRADYRCAARPDVVNSDGSEVGVCVPACETDADCEAGRRCDASSGDCVPRGEKATGADCRNNEQCNGGLCLQGTSFRGGYCSGRCGSQFSACEPGSECATLDGQAVCLGGCNGDADCRADEGYKCRQIAQRADNEGDPQPVSVCVPKCQSNDECADGSHCDAASGDCMEGVGAPNPLGAFCAAAGDCATDTCLTGADWPNGYCSAGCEGCAGTCGQVGGNPVCLAACEGDLACRAGYVCSGGGCVGPCGGDADCGEGQRCNQSSGKCVDRATGGAELRRLNVARGVEVGGFLSESIELEIPEGALSFAVLAEGSGEDLMVIGEMTDPNGTLLYDFQDPFGSKVRFFPDADLITQMVPTSPRTAPVAGTYTFKLIKDGGTKDIDVDALIKVADGEPEGGRLDINFFFVKPGDVSGGSAANDADFQRAVNEMKTIYGQRGVEIGEIFYCDVSGADADRYAVVDSVDGPSSELSRMFALSGRASSYGCSDEPALNFFLVQEIVGGRAGYIILGVAGGIPGNPDHGSTHSGVAVTMSGWRARPIQLAQTMAHEGGHFLGLFHTTEAEGNAFDPLPDTPECGSGNDRDNDGVVGYGECGSGRGNENLMFWAAGDSADQVSGDQGFVLIRNPKVQ
jgi:hypothetical protein